MADCLYGMLLGWAMGNGCYGICQQWFISEVLTENIQEHCGTTVEMITIERKGLCHNKTGDRRGECQHEPESYHDELEIDRYERTVKKSEELELNQCEFDGFEKRC